MTDRVVGAYEAKTNLAALLGQAEAGATITITRRGKPVARLVPVEQDEAASAQEALTQLKALKAKRRREGWPEVTIEEIIQAKHEGHDY